MALPHATLYSSASSAIAGWQMHQIPLCSFAVPPSWTLPGSPANVTFLSSGPHTLEGLCWFRKGDKSTTNTDTFLKWECICQQGFVGFMARNESSPSLRQFSQHPTMSRVYLDPPSAPVPWWLGLLHYVTLLPCYHPCSLIDSTRFLFKVSADFRHLYSYISVISLISFGGASGSRQVRMLSVASTYNMQKRFPTSVASMSACSGSFVLVTFSQLNENPPQRLMPSEAIREAQIHLLSSLKNIPTILQSRQDRNEAELRSLTDPLSQGGGLAHFLSDIPLS